MKYAAKMGLGATMCTPSVINIRSGIQKYMGGGNSQTGNNTRRIAGRIVFYEVRVVSGKSGDYFFHELFISE